MNEVPSKQNEILCFYFKIDVTASLFETRFCRALLLNIDAAFFSNTNTNRNAKNNTNTNINIDSGHTYIYTTCTCTSTIGSTGCNTKVEDDHKLSYNQHRHMGKYYQKFCFNKIVTSDLSGGKRNRSMKIRAQLKISKERDISA